jgi:carboxypeptidase family protein
MSWRLKSGVLAVALLLNALLLNAGLLAAQSKSRGISITGAVLDPSGASAPDSTVTLRQGATNVASTHTDLEGRFVLNNVAPGSYTLEVKHEGFKDTAAQLRVSTKPPAPLRVTLALAAVSSQLDVSGADVAEVSTDIASNLDAAAVDQSLLSDVPVFDQDYVATMSAFLDSAATGTSGTQLIVDGLAATSVGVTSSAIQEVRINQNPYSAEYARPGRGSIEIITKSTTSDYHGVFNFTFRDSALNARDPFALTRAPEQRRIFEGSLTGPIGHSKTTSFLLSGHRQEEDLQSIVNATGPNGPIQMSIPSPRRDTQLSVRVTHQFNPDHAVFWQYNEWDYPASNQGVGGFVLPEAATESRQWEREAVFNDRLTLSPHWLSQFQILVGSERHFFFSKSSNRKIIVQDAFTAGGAQRNQLETELHFQLNEIVSWSAGKHSLKFGVNIPDWSRRGEDIYNNFGGTYYFSSLDDYAAGLPYAYRQQQGSGHVVFVQKELGGFIQDEYRLRPNFSLSLGLRYNWQNFLGDNTDFAPRLAFAYGLGRNAKTVLRGGAGVFHDRTGPGPIMDLHLYNGAVLRNLLITDPSYPDPFAKLGPPSSLPTDITRFDPSITEPYTIQYSLGVERQLAKRTTLAITYTGSRGIDLYRSRDINAPFGPAYLSRPDAALGLVRQVESAGRQISDSLEFTLRGTVTRYFTGLMQYTLSRTDNDSGGINWFPTNQYDLTGERGRADFDQRHRFNLLESLNPGKWFTLGIGLTVASGKPYTLTTGDDPFHTGLANARPDGVARNTLEGPGYADFDLRWSRDFDVSKVKKDKGPVITVAFDAFNVLNHVNFTSYVGNLSSPSFGKAVSAQPSRRLQLTARFKF